jgi:pantoate--beta-alanine ligase
MQTLGLIAELRETIREWRAAGDCIAFVPTMGNLHDGHLRLVDEARRESDRVVVSVFVNPSQFGPSEDFGAYPRTPAEDAGKLSALGVDLLYLPDVAEIYPEDPANMTFVEVPGLSEDLCGGFRPGHFRGVATVVLKLFNQVQPDLAVFGEKDFQQLTMIRRMVRDMDLAVEILGVPTVREPTGLAMSSRNAYLAEEDRVRAGLLYAGLCQAVETLHQGCRDFSGIEAHQTSLLAEAGFSVDYFAIRRQEDLLVPRLEDERLVVLVAARLSRTRLIDNLKVCLHHPS